MARTTTSLEGILAARKAQVKTAQKQSTELLLSRAPNLLASAKVDERKKIIAALEEASLTSGQLQPLLRPLLLRFSDDSERCRDGAVGLVHRWQKGCDSAGDVAGICPFLMPVMVERLGSESVREPSEEVRAALVGLMRDVLLQCKALLRPHIHEVGAIALGCCRDTHPEVIKGLCDLLACIASSMLAPLCKDMNRGGPKAVKPFSQKLLEAVLPHIRHRHAAVRLQVLHALEELLLCGAGQSVETLTGWRLKNNVPIAEFYGKGAPRINYLADLSRDRSVLVRRKLVQVAARWVREMDGEDLYEQEVRIMPYLISGVTDDDDECSKLAISELEKLGNEYLEKEMKDYKERIEYGHADELRATAAITLPSPKPLPGRPPMGARERVRTHFRHLIHPICAELDLWTSTERLQSARLLEVLLAYTEGYVTEFAHQLLPALAKGMDTDTKEAKALAEVVGRCAAQFAQHTEPEEYLPLLISKAATDPLNPLSQRIQFLSLLPHLLHGMRPPARARALVHLTPLLEDEQLVTSLHTPLRAAVLASFEAMGSAARSIGGKGGEGGEDDALARLAAKMGGSSLLPTLLYALASHIASAPALQPKIVQLSDGLEQLEEAGDEAWEAAAETARSLTEPWDGIVNHADDDAKTVRPRSMDPAAASARRPWELFGQSVRRRIEMAFQSEDEYATLTRRLVDMLGGGLAAGQRDCDEQSDGAGAHQSSARGVAAARQPAAAPGSPRKVLAISEVDDFTDEDSDDEEEDVKVNIVKKGEGAPASTTASPAAAPVDIDDFEDELD